MQPEVNDFNEPVKLVRYRDFVTRTIFKAFFLLIIGYQVVRNLDSPFYAMAWATSSAILFAQAKHMEMFKRAPGDNIKPADKEPKDD